MVHLPELQSASNCPSARSYLSHDQKACLKTVQSKSIQNSIYKNCEVAGKIEHLYRHSPRDALWAPPQYRPPGSAVASAECASPPSIKCKWHIFIRRQPRRKLRRLAPFPIATTCHCHASKMQMPKERQPSMTKLARSSVKKSDTGNVLPMLQPAPKSGDTLVCGTGSPK